MIPIELPRLVVGRIVEARLLCELPGGVLPALRRVMASDRPHRGVGVDRRRINADRLAPQEAFVGRVGQDEADTPRQRSPSGAACESWSRSSGSVLDRWPQVGESRRATGCGCTATRSLDAM